MKELSWRLAIVLIVVIVATIYILPTANPKFWPYKKMNLGLDLQGGLHLLLEVDAAKAVESTIEHSTQEMRDAIKAKSIGSAMAERVENDKILVKITKPEDTDKFQKLLDEEFTNLRILSKTTEESTQIIKMDMPEKEADRIKKSASEQAMETIRNRIDQYGVSEPDIRRQGDNRILAQLPGVEDVKRAKDLIGKTAMLEFKIVDESKDPETLKGNTPPGTEILYQVKNDKDTRRELKTPFLLQKHSPLTGTYLTDAKVQIDSQYNEPYVSISFDKKGAKLFERITGENVKKRLAIVLDKKVYSAPVIQERIAGGEARITGSFTMDEARDLAIVLRAGALPAPVNIIEERTVGASLGSDSIFKGLLSMCVGSILMVVFMAIYYRMSGVMADFALLLNILFVCGGLAALQATLTMPGIAGIILTIGMAVDANVLVFERIREELRLGKSFHAAVTAGYERAGVTILDANVTTLIAAVVLFQFGTGIIKGFAVTLSLGVLSSMFTALFVTRLIFDYFLLVRKVKSISI